MVDFNESLNGFEHGQASTSNSQFVKTKADSLTFKKLAKEPWFFRLSVVSISGCLLAHFNVYHEASLNNLYKPVSDWLKEQYDPFQVDTVLMPLMASSTHAGMLLGGTFLAAYVVDTFGRRKVNITMSVILLISAVILFSGILLKTVWLILIARLLTGIAFGMSLLSVNLMLTESAPTDLRGAFTALPIVFYSLGDLLGVLLTSPFILGSDELWPFAMLFGYIPAIIGLPFHIWSHESPRHTFLKLNNVEGSTISLQFYQGRSNCDVTLEDLANEQQHQQREMSYSELWTNRLLRHSTRLLVFIHVACQLAGIKIVIQFSTPILENSGLSHVQATSCTIFIGFIKLISSFLGMSCVQRLGRRRSCFIGLGLCSGLLLIIAIVTLIMEPSGIEGVLVAVLLTTYMTVYNVLSAAVNVLTGELLPQQARAKAMVSVNTITFMIATVLSYLVPITFQTGSFSTAIFALSISSFLILTFLVRKLPETAGRTFQGTQEEVRSLIE